MCECNADIQDTEHFLRCHFYSTERFELFNNINRVDFSFTQLGTKEQVNILLNGYPPKKPNTLKQDIAKFVINIFKTSGRFNKLLIIFNQWFYVLLFFFLHTCLLYVVISLLGKNCKFAAYNWRQISFINTFHLQIPAYLFLFFYVTIHNLQTLKELCSFIISVCLLSLLCCYMFLFSFFLYFMFVNLIL